VRVLFLSAMIVLADQLTKLLVKGAAIPWLGIAWPGLPYGTSRPVLGDLLRLTYIENPGMAFGIDLGGKPWFALFSVAASAAIIWYLYRMRTERLGFRIALAMILGGAVGNLIDRILYGVLFDTAPLLYGRVVDFIDVDFFDVTLWGYHISRWPVFNIADACVTMGVILLLVYHRTAVAEESPQLERPAAPPTSQP
jgi:signal peptidase II